MEAASCPRRLYVEHKNDNIYMLRGSSWSVILRFSQPTTARGAASWL
jgi:hypothetical protein